MTPSRSPDLFLLLASGLPVMACASNVADSDDGGSNQGMVDAAVDACGPYAKKISDCYAAEATEYGYSYLTSLGYCIAYLGYADLTGTECRAAMEDQFACLAQLDCEEIVVDVVDEGDDAGTGSGSTGEEPPHPCEAEQTKVADACNFDDE